MNLRAVVLVIVMGLCGAASAERLRSPTGEVKEVPESSVDFAIRDGYTRLGTVYFRRQDNSVARLYDEPGAIAHGETQGWWRMTKEEIDAYERQEAERSVQRIHDDIERDEAAKWWKQPIYVGVLAVAISLAAVFAMHLMSRGKPKI